ncbi:Membrane metallo-endopeptidase-like 1 [Apodemus speciosus]|uniref:Membrane metallo-endopeptidase-like 1 n=1 Tax=Apodemus speciosus TaxID=105296 RepID=A0ABQ0FAQ0_APOSI
MGVSLCSPGCPGTHSVNQAGLELRNPPASASQVLGLKVIIWVLLVHVIKSIWLIEDAASGLAQHGMQQGLLSGAGRNNEGGC